MFSSYLIRETLKWPGLPYREIQSNSNFSLPSTDQGQELYDRYYLKIWRHWMSKATLNETLGTLDLLNHLPIAEFKNYSGLQKFITLDIGSKNWRYVGALAAWMNLLFPNQNKKTVGIELDAYRLYSNFRTRIAYARFFENQFSNPNHHFCYYAGDVRNLKSKYHLITWFFPFVSIDPHLRWGLPKSYFDPEDTFSHAEFLLTLSGKLIMANQGKWEWELANKFFKKLKLSYQKELGESLHTSPYPIFLSVWEKTL